MKIYKLPYRPIPQPDESPASLLIRTVDGNGFDSIIQLLKACGVLAYGVERIRQALTNRQLFEEMIEALGLTPVCSSVVFLRTKPTLRSPRLLMNAAVPEKLFREDAASFCPVCLKEQPYWRRYWALRPYVVCHIHGGALLHCCPSCLRVPSLLRGQLFICKCGTDWRDCTASPEDQGPSRWLYQQLIGKDFALLDRCFSFWLTMKAFDLWDDSVENEQGRLRLMIAWGYEHRIVYKEIKRLVILQTPQQHPRHQLLPFLKKGALLAGFARQVLSGLGPVTYQYCLTEKSGYLSKQDAALVLGLSVVQMNECIKEGLLTPRRQKLSRSCEIALCDVLNFLGKLQAPTVYLGKHKVRSSNQSIAVLAKGILNGNLISAGYDLDKGLSYLRIAESSLSKELSTQSLNVGQASAILGIHQEILRSFVKKGWLIGESHVVDGSRRLLIHAERLEQFQAEFVTAGELGRSIQTNITNYAEKLRSIGVIPIAGPAIDGSLVYLFRRADLVGVDLLSLRNLAHYETRAGRKKANSEVKKSGILLTEAAIQLRISPQQTSSLIRKGILIREAGLSREIRVTEESLLSLLHIILSPCMTTLAEAAAAIGYTEHRFRHVFIRTGFVKLVDLPFWKLVSEAAVDFVVDFVKTWVTASEAGQLFNMHRSYLPNLEVQGLIKSFYLGSGPLVSFYNRQDLLNLENTIKSRFNSKSK
ncbi:TniQ family protein [Iodobacter arcticus]|uniref:TniQ family protein n=1 Tax=Iodobacter arcticus TaxID=590593 RepID=A0ABW2R2H4_9NEIS